MAAGIKFGDKHTGDLGLKMLSTFVMSAPEPYVETVEIPGRNGVLDYSEAVAGHITYNEREFEIEFSLMGDDAEDYQAKLDAIVNAIHGKRLKMILDSDADFYYTARPIVEEEKETDFFGILTISGTAYPYKRKLQETQISKSVAGILNITCNNLAEPVIPEVTTSAAMKLTFGETVFNVEAGTHTLDMVFASGSNIIKAEGTGTVTFKYREGCL